MYVVSMAAVRYYSPGVIGSILSRETRNRRLRSHKKGIIERGGEESVEIDEVEEREEERCPFTPILPIGKPREVPRTYRSWDGDY
jgi:hypothetical protein